MKNSILSLALTVPLLAITGCDEAGAEPTEPVGLPDPVEDDSMNEPPPSQAPPSDLGAGAQPGQMPGAPPPGQQPPGQLGQPPAGHPGQPGAVQPSEPMEPSEPNAPAGGQPGAAPGTPTP